MTLIQPEIAWDVAFEAYSPYDDWREKRDTDITWCMRCTIREVAEDGTIAITSKLCGEPDCPNCGPKLRENMKKALTRKLLQTPLRKITLTGSIEQQKTERARIIRKYGKDKISIFANDIISEKGIGLETEILIDTKDEIGDEYVTLTEDDLYKWSQKSFNAKKSGNLHKTRIVVAGTDPELPEPEPAKKIEETVYQVEIEHIKTDCKDKDVLKELEKQVVGETKHLDPKSIEDLQNALIARRIVRHRIYDEQKIVILSNRSSKTPVLMSRVDWQKPKKIVF